MSHRSLSRTAFAVLMLCSSATWAQTSSSSSPAAAVSPTTLSFSAIEVGRPAPPKFITVRNSGGGQLSITGASVSGAAATDFGVANPCK